MPRVDWVTCEPFRAWNRLEPRTRKEDFDEVLQCAVHDPLWMLTRQWQFGEFKGEDTGSAIFAKIKIQTTKPAIYKSANELKEKYMDVIPAEAKVESEHPVPNHHAMVESAMYFLKLLDHHLGTALPDYSRTNYLNKLKQLFPLLLPQTIGATDNHEETVRKLKQLVNEPLHTFLDVFSTRSFDGKTLYEQAKANAPGIVDTITLNPDHTPKLQLAVTDYIAWYEKTYKPAYNTSGKGAWINEQLEYQFRLALPEKSGNNTVLLAEEYYTGDLEWYSFDIDQTLPASDELLGPATTEERGLVSEKVISVIPTLAKYAGMPHPRWWQFEDGNIDLGNIDADTTDISKLIVSEYALIYGNDWLIVPYPLPAGSLTDVKGIVVRDVFGQKSFVGAALQGKTDDWNTWGLFNLSVRHPDNDKTVPADTRLFLPPCVAKTMESEPIEEILFVRDEMANLVWAIETKVDHGAGGSMDGHTFITYLRNAIEQIEPLAFALPVDEKAMFKYTLENTVPENWIPFVPVHISGQNRAIRLQRASMPRWFKNEYAAVRPNTRLLREGINNLDAVTKPLFVNEEEIPRTGSKVTSCHQRTRWYSGKVITWIGKRKNLGRGEGSSGLQFDYLEAVSKKKATI